MIAYAICGVLLIVAIFVLILILELRDDPWIGYQPRHSATPAAAAAADPVPLPVAGSLTVVADPDETASMPVVAARFLP